MGKIRLHRLFKIVFVIIFCLNFTAQKIVDNEAICGMLGSVESTCQYSFLDHSFGIETGHDIEEEGDHKDHVCLSCPCNLQLVVSWDLNLYPVLISLNKVYLSFPTLVFLEYSTTEGYFRPPRENIT